MLMSLIGTATHHCLVAIGTILNSHLCGVSRFPGERLFNCTARMVLEVQTPVHLTLILCYRMNW